MWPETEKAKLEIRHELVLTGKEIKSRIEKDGLDMTVFCLEGLNFLNISDVNLREIPDQIESLANLQELVLYSNNIETVNEAVVQLQKLKLLDLSRNKIKQIPEGIANLEHLVTLNLSGNELETVPTFSKNSKLAAIDFSNNALKTFPDICRAELVNLMELKLSGNQIEEIPTSICKLPLLKVLDVSSNKIKTLPGELADCSKLKDVNVKSNPITDRRLRKLIDQCGTKQVLDYVKNHCPRTAPDESCNGSNKKSGNRGKKSGEDQDHDVSDVDYKYTIVVKPALDLNRVSISEDVKNVREHFLGCVVNNVSFTEETFKKFIQLQNKLHDTVCDKRNAATIATHDYNKLPQGDLTYTTAAPKELVLKPLNRANEMTGAELFSKLQTEANNYRKEKKRNTYSGIHKYLYLIEGKAQYPCLRNAKNEVISFPPITNSDISKIEVQTTRMFIECTSSLSLHICKTVVDTLLKEMVLLFEKDLEVQQVITTNMKSEPKTFYPSKTDLKFEKTVPIKIKREFS